MGRVVPKPRAAGDGSEAMAAVTVFVTKAERAAVLRRLRRVHRDRRVALLRALGVKG